MRKKKSFGKKVLLGSAVALLATTLMATGGVYADALPSSTAIPSVIDKTTSSVVAIIGKPSDGKKVSEADRYELAHGTGVVVRSDGVILTNAHVVKNMRNLTVVTSEGKSYTGKTTHYDEESDLALIKIDAFGLKAATFARPSDIRVGESVVAIGTPLSFALRNSVSYGIVSGMERSVQSKYRLIQTDAAINPGNSGGALVNMKGEVIGINTMKYVEYGVDSLGFAIPVDTVQHVLDHFYKYGRVKRATIGLELAESWEAVVGLPSTSGLEVTYVEADSAGAKSGIRQGDVLQTIDKTSVANIVEYNEALKNKLPGEKIKLTLLSEGKTKELEVTLDEDNSGTAEVQQDSDGAYIDADQGKTEIGDSHYGWSMKYPAGLAKANQSTSGGNVTFADAKGSYGIDVRVQEKQSRDLSPYGLLSKLNGRSLMNMTVLEKKYVEDARQPYAMLAGENENGMYFQLRAYLKEDRIYIVTLFVNGEGEKAGGSKRNSSMDLLDSFKLEFDAKNESLKDISAYQNKTTITTNYGLSFDLPEEWSESYSGNMVYSDKEDDQTLTVTVTSAASGDTLKDWAKRQEQKFLDRYVDGYRETTGQKETTAGGVTAIENRYNSTMGDKWTQTYKLYTIKDKYKYELSLSFPKEDSGEEQEKLIAELVNSVQFSKESLKKSLGTIQDVDDLIDKSGKVTYTNQKYRFAIKTPELWSGGYEGETDTAYKTFSFTGGSLNISSDDRSSLDEALNRTEQEYKKNAETDANYKYTATDEALFDTTVKKFSVQYKSKNVPYTQNEYVFEKNGIVYTVRARINDAVKTEVQWQNLNDAVQSLTFTEK